ncbi:MAG: polysaccharide deacetylase family protein [candidate division KSB1 bacterium]|nr:polysaccharide deacetylase family protein [candidate division KSB1 bacterium]
MSCRPPSHKPEKLLDYLSGYGIHKVTLLVVPGKEWDRKDIMTLRSLQNQGHQLAGHGWIHHVDACRSVYHKLHALVISRRVAEHLSLSESEIAALIRRCHHWFPDNGLQVPELYVPPAWAMGKISRQRLRELPFRCYEFLNGLYDSNPDRFEPMPLLGFEADTRLRRSALRLNNAVNRLRSRRQTGRIAIHPHDLDLYLRPDMDQLFSSLVNRQQNPFACSRENLYSQ